MADTPQNGNNTGNNANNTPVINYTGGRTDASNRGVLGHINSQLARERLNERSFNDENGIMQTALKSLEMMSAKYAKLSTAEEKMTKAQKKRFDAEKKAIAENQALIKRATEMGEMSIDELTKLEKETEKRISDLNKKMKSSAEEYGKLIYENEQQRNDELNRTLELVDEIKNSMNHAGETFKEDLKEAKKNTEGLAESIASTSKKLGSAIGDISKILNIEKLAQNDLTQMIDSRYDAYNKIALNLGASAKEAANIYNNQVDELNSLNSKTDNHFSMSEMRSWFDEMLNQGITDKELLEKNLSQGVAANKYLGVTADTQTSMLKYMKLTDNSDLMLQTNMQIAALTKAGIGINQQILNNSINNGIELAESLDGIGVDAEAQAKLIEQSVVTGQAMNAAGVSESSIKTMEDFAATVGTAGYDKMAGLIKQLGGEADVFQLQDQVRNGDLQGFYKTMADVIGNAYYTQGETSVNATLQDYFGNADIAKSFKQLYTNFDKYSEAIGEYQKQMDSVAPEDRDEYIQKLTEEMAMSPTEKTVNKISGTLDEIKGFLNTDIGQYLGLASVALTGLGGGIDLVSKFIDTATNIGILNKLSGASGVLSGAGATGGILATGGASLLVTGVAAAVIAGVHALSNKLHEGETGVNDNADAYLKANEGTIHEGNAGLANLQANIAEKNSNKLGKGFVDGVDIVHNVSELKSRFGLGKGDISKYNQNKWKNLAPTGDENALTWLAMAYSIALDEVGDTKSINSLFGMSVSDVQSFLKSELKSDGDNANKQLQNAYNNMITYQLIPVGANKKDWDRTLDVREFMGVDDSEPKGGADYVQDKGFGNVISQDYGMPTGNLLANAGGYTNIEEAKNKPFPSYTGHKGMDFAATAGTPIGAAMGGTVITSGYGNRTGNWVQIRGDDGLIYTYMHMVSAPPVPVGAKVGAGDVIGYVGSTGNSTGNHLHFQVSSSLNGWNSSAVLDPHPYVNDNIFAPSGQVWGEWNGEVNNPSGDSGSSSTKGSNSNKTSALAGLMAGTRAPTKPTGQRAMFAMGGASDISDSSNKDIVRAVNDVSKNIIGYLNSLREEQESQRKILDAFSKAQSSSPF